MHRILAEVNKRCLELEEENALLRKRYDEHIETIVELKTTIRNLCDEICQQMVGYLHEESLRRQEGP